MKGVDKFCTISWKRAIISFKHKQTFLHSMNNLSENDIIFFGSAARKQTCADDVSDWYI